MKKVFRRTRPIFYLSHLTLSGVLLIGCTQNSPPAPSAPANTPPPQAEPLAMPQAVSPMTPPEPPQPQQLSLYMVQQNPGGFSMESIQASKKKIEKEPNDVPSLISLGDANFMIQRFEASQGYYERALKADPKNINARLSLSNCLIFMQKPDEAIKQLDQILAIQKNSPEALYNKGLILLQSKGNAAGAKQAWTRLTQSHPEHPLTQQVKGELAKL
ncbi:MAG: tetratricopeptide repeat protein [Nitrospirae bacterium]|nr:tetratricopeptide repeat protein [Nitrospirota bacterium]